MPRPVTIPLEPSDLKSIRSLDSFAELSSKTTTELLRAASVRHFAPNSVLFREGEGPTCVYVVLDGLVVLKVSDTKANEFVIRFIGPGRPFVLAAVIANRPYITTGQVIQSGRILEIPADVYRRAVDRDAKLAMVALRDTVQDSYTLVTHIKTLKMLSGTERLASFLVSLADKEDGAATVVLPCERQLLAGWLGIVPTTVSRAFRQLKEYGVEGRGQSLTIKSVKRLRQFARI